MNLQKIIETIGYNPISFIGASINRKNVDGCVSVRLERNELFYFSGALVREGKNKKERSEILDAIQNARWFDTQSGDAKDGWCVVYFPTVKFAEG